MNQLKSLIKKYFTSFTFFYRYVGNRIFIMVGLSLAVSVLDGFGLTMFLPMLQMVSGDGSVDAEQMGNLRFLIDGAENLGIPMSLVSVLIIMIVFFAFKGIATYINQVYRVILQQKFIKTVRFNLLNALNRMSFKNFILSDAGQIQNTMSGEVDRVSNAFNAYFASFQQAIMVVVYMGFAFFVDWKFAILVSIGGAVTNILYKTIYTKTKSQSRKLTGTSHIYQGLIIQHVANFKYLRATGMTAPHSEKLENSINNIEEARRKIGILESVSSAVREPMLVVVVAAVILIQIKVLDGEMGGILISLLFFYRALAALINMQQTWNFFMANSGSLENMQAFQKELTQSKSRNGKEKLESFTNEITVKNVDFNYGDTRILNNINLQIPKNQSIAFVGESGSGKTTLVNLLAGLFSPNQGSIQIDDIGLQDLDRNTYQKRIGYITQEAVIFNDTIYNNVSFWAEKTAENIARFEKAIQQAAIYEFIKELPDGMETELGNNGINLSGGQRQRISIARELFKDIDILIMDEATSALDSETERIIQESIESLQGQYTLIIVAHRLATIRNVDQVVYMHDGNIEDQGSFDELVARHERFKKMVELQEL